MELSNEFTVAAPIEQAWAVLTDVETHRAVPARRAARRRSRATSSAASSR